MKKILSILFILFFGISTMAQNDTTLISYYDNGKVKEVLCFNESNRLDGTCVAYSPAGTQIGIASYRDGVKDGVWKIWRENGILAYEMYYENGQKTGKWKVYDEEGNIKEERVFN